MARQIKVVEAWGKSSVPGKSGETVWERKNLHLIASQGYEVFSRTLSLDQGGDWRVGVYDDVDEATFTDLLPTMKRVPDSDIYPVYEDGLAKFDVESAPEDSYFLKRPSVTSWHESDIIAQLFLSEARINEQFRSNPHPHLGVYLGCVVSNGRIVRLAFPKFATTLGDRVEQVRKGKAPPSGAQEQQAIMRTIKDAVAHIHSMGYAHNDISASNIMFDGSGKAVLIDLDSCVPFGDKIKKGGRAGGWRGPFQWGQQFEFSSVECDLESIKYIENWLSCPEN